MKSSILIGHLANANLSFLKTVNNENIPPLPEPEKYNKIEVLKTIQIKQPIRDQPQSWSNDIAELENFFSSIELPKQPLKLNQCSTIIDCSLFIESHFISVKANDGKRRFLPYLRRLQELKQILTVNYN